jgi:lysine N6-hydroxylase
VSAPRPDVYDVVGIGIGPSNLSLAALLDPFEDVRALFLDRTRELVWHPGLLFPEAEIQVSFLKDLVTLVDPTSRYSFLSFLHRQKRLYRFIHAEFQRIRRSEFNQYLRWVAAELPNLRFSRAVEAVTWDDGLVVHANGERIRTRHLALATGLSPCVPECARPWLSDSVFHSCEYLIKGIQPAGKRVMVVGGGQSGAEVVAQILASSSTLPRELYWISRRPNFLPLDESPFANEWFTPTYSEYFFRLPAQLREKLVADQKLASDGISVSLLKGLCQRLYELDFLAPGQCAYHLWPGREVCRVSREPEGWRVESRDVLSGSRTEVEVDYLILCTGYSWVRPAYLEPILDRIELVNGEFHHQEDYSIVWDGLPEHRIYVQNAARNARGIADPNLSLLAWRSAKIINSLLGRKAYDVEDGAVPVVWDGLGTGSAAADLSRAASYVADIADVADVAGEAGRGGG